MNVKKPDEQTRVFDCVVEKITLVNSYNGIQAGPSHNGRHRIYDIYGCAPRCGIMVDNTRDIGRIENIHWHCVYWGQGSHEWRLGQGFQVHARESQGLPIRRTDWEYVHNTFSQRPANCKYRTRPLMLAPSMRKPGNAWAQPDARPQPGSVHLKPGVEHAVIRGNNGYYG